MPKTSDKVIHPELSYVINGLLFEIHNALGRFCREKQYGDALATLMEERQVYYEREKALPLKLVEDNLTNKVDFIVNGQVILELKAKPIITKDDYYQVQRYLEAANLKLGIIANFRSKYLRPIRIIRSNS
jgi:GxxExxY protein